MSERDDSHLERKPKNTPEPEALGQDPRLRGIFDMIGAGREGFAGADADEYVRRLREGWD
jgi:hypothetical protein